MKRVYVLWKCEVKRVLNSGFTVLAWTCFLVPFILLFGRSQGAFESVSPNLPGRTLIQAISGLLVALTATLQGSSGQSNGRRFVRFSLWLVSLCGVLLFVTALNYFLLKPSLMRNRPAETTEAIFPGIELARSMRDGSAAPSGFAARQACLVLIALAALTGRKGNELKKGDLETEAVGSGIKWAEGLLFALLLAMSALLVHVSIAESRHTLGDLALGFAAAHFLLILILYFTAVGREHQPNAGRILLAFCFCLGFPPMAFMLSEAPANVTFLLLFVFASALLYELRGAGDGLRSVQRTARH